MSDAAARPACWPADGLLLACAVIWGSTFPIVRSVLADISPQLLTASRFAIAGMLLLPLAFSIPAAQRRATAMWSLILGSLLAAGFLLQSIGLVRIGAGRSAFLTSLYVLATPLLERLLTRHRIPPRSALGALVCVGGAAVMSGPASIPSSARFGDLITVAAAGMFAAHIVLLTRALRSAPWHALLGGQIVACGVASAASALLLETPRLRLGLGLAASILFLAVVATVLALGLQVYAQRRTSPTRAALLFASEPVWAALLALAIGEWMTAREVLGAIVITAGILLGTVAAPSGSAHGSGISPGSTRP